MPPVRGARLPAAVALAALLLLSPGANAARLLLQDDNSEEHPKCPEVRLQSDLSVSAA